MVDEYFSIIENKNGNWIFLNILKWIEDLNRKVVIKECVIRNVMKFNDGYKKVYWFLFEKFLILVVCKVVYC